MYWLIKWQILIKKSWAIKQSLSYPKIPSTKFFKNLQLSGIDFFQIWLNTKWKHYKTLSRHNKKKTNKKQWIAYDCLLTFSGGFEFQKIYLLEHAVLCLALHCPDQSTLVWPQTHAYLQLINNKPPQHCVSTCIKGLYDNNTFCEYNSE